MNPKCRTFRLQARPGLRVLYKSNTIAPACLSRFVDRFHVMRHKFINWFAIILLVLLALWIGGIVTGVVIPLFGGIRAERIGMAAFGAAAVAETILVVTECFLEWANRRKPGHRKDFAGPTSPKLCLSARYILANSAI